MDGSPSITGGGRPIVLNHNGLEDEEDHDTDSSEDEESPPQLEFTDGSCSDSQLSQDSTGNSPSPSEVFEQPEPGPLILDDSTTPDASDANKDIIADASVAEADTVVQLGADGEPDNSDPSSAEVESTVTMEVEAVQMLESQASSCHVTYDVTVTVNEPSTSTEMSDTFLAVKPSTSTETSDSTSTVEPSTSTEANDTALPVAEPSTSSETTEHAPAVEPCTSLSDDMDTEEVDMEVSSGDEDEPQALQNSRTTLEEKRRIEENIQALMKDFERKRLEEKARKAAEAPPLSRIPLFLRKIVSACSEVSSATDLKSEQKPSIKVSTTRSNGERVHRGPSTPADSPLPAETSEDLPQCSSSAVKDEPESCEKDDLAIELPSSSVEVPPVPTYEEIEQCIYKVENKKKAMSLMCFCRGNNLDCSDSRCDNRAMFTECPKNCLGKNKDCRNRRFSKREYAPVQAFYTGPNKGFGVQAVAPIKKGEFIIEYVGEVVSSEEFAKRLKKYGRDPTHTHHYMFEIGSMIIDATVKGNCSRFMNHSCEPNAVCEKWYVPRTPCAIDRIGFFAKRDIELGEEITFDYQFENYGREAQRCFCGTSACTGWIGKPPEMLDDDDELESPSEESGVSEEEEDEKLAEQAVLRRKRSHRFATRDNVTIGEVESRLQKALTIGCRNKTHVLGWIKLMTEMALIRRENGVMQSMYRIIEAISSVDTSLQHIFVANGLPNIFKSWLRTSNPESLTREDLDLKHCIIRSLLSMQSCAEAINARAPDLLAMVVDLVGMPTPDVLSVKDAMEGVIHQLCSEEESTTELNRFHESLELRFERVRNAAIRLQAVLQQHVNFRIPKKKVNVIPSSSKSVQLPDAEHRPDSRDDDRRFFRFQDRGHQFMQRPPFPRDNLSFANGRQRLRSSRWGAECAPMKRTRSASRERIDDFVIRCRIGPTITQTTITPEHPPFMKRSRPADIEELPPVVVTRVRPNWPPPAHPPVHPPVPPPAHPAQHAPAIPPAVAPSIPPPPPPHMLSPSPMLVPPPPPALPPPVYPAPVPYYDYGPYPPLPPVPHVPSYPSTTAYDYSRAPVDDFDPEEYRQYYQSCDVSMLQLRLQSLMKEMSILKSVLDLKTKEKEEPSPIPPPTPQPPIPKTPPPPPHKEYMWRKAVDEDGTKYYYHRETRESAWELPDGEESDPGERTPTRMPDTSGCGNDTESDNVEVSTSNIVTPAQSSSRRINGAPPTSEKKRDRDRRIWEKFGNDADRKRAKKLMGEIEKVVGPIIMRHLSHREDATKRKKDWIIKQVSKEMLKRESERADFNFTLTEKGSKRVTDYADAFIQRKCAKEPKELWKGYDGSP